MIKNEKLLKWQKHNRITKILTKIYKKYSKYY